MNFLQKHFNALTYIAALCFSIALQAATTDIANTPLSQAGANAVRPNLMFVLDDSGSMGNNYMPDNVVNSNQCRLANGDQSCTNGEPPFYSAQFNGAYYDPATLYKPAVNPCDTANTLPEMNSANTSGFSAVRDDGLAINSTTCAQTSGTTNILTGYPEMIFCNTSAPTSPTLNDANCRRNGINQLVAGATGAGGFKYTTQQVLGDYDFPDNVSSTTVAVPWYSTAAPFTSGTFIIPRVVNGSNPHYYTITPREYCTDSSLVTCTLSTTPTGSFVVPALVRYCRNSTIASSNALVSDALGTALGTTSTTGAQCNSKYIGPYDFVRYGIFTRTDIVSTNNSYPRAISRTDCAGATCTYQEEMTNFANWRAYYSTRIKFMKTGAGRAFAGINDAYRVGFITINPGNPVAASEYLRLANFDSTQKIAWFKKLYSQGVGPSTPLREALARVGRYYGNRAISGIPAGDDPQPEKYSCQQNFALLTTDGYWNGNAGVQLDGATAIGNEDNTESTYIKRAEGSLQPDTSSGSLADVAAYYYKNDLRTDIADQNATIAALNTKDPAPHQHMTTFTLGLGLDGSLSYTPDYETATTGDFVSIKNATKNWPPAVNDDPTALDDLWHAAVNGHGTYFSAKNPSQLIDGIQSTLAGIEERKASGGAASISAPNITTTDNSRFSTTYKTKEWSGDLVLNKIDPFTNVVGPNVWSAQAKMNTGFSRPVYFFDNSLGRRDFTLVNLSTIEQSYFKNLCSPSNRLSQCAQLTTTAKTIADSGTGVISFLRGDQTNEGSITAFDRPFRDREHVLGDIVGGGAEVVKAPRFNYIDSGYSNFKSINTGRTSVVFTAANDGMLHAFDATTGAPLWSYVPKGVMQEMYRLADKSYANNHRFFVDAKPTISDINVGGTWKTVLVGGYGAGARGYYALDITNPSSPVTMWEICGVTQPTLAADRVCSRYEPNIGFSSGNPVFFKQPSGVWTIAVTSGYNNVNPGDGNGHLYFLDPATGNQLNDYTTGVGSTSSIVGLCSTAPCPSGLGKIGAFAKDSARDATVTFMYIGDLFGNIHRLDLTSGAMSVMATLSGPSGNRQPITTKPIVSLVKNVNEPIVFVGTGQYLGTSDITDASVQSLYAMRDKGTPYGNPRGTLIKRTITRSGNDAIISSTGDVNWATGGWYIDLTAVSKERVNIDPKLALGTLVVGTNIPGDGACTAGGSSAIYQFSFATGLPVLGGATVGKYNNDSLLAGFALYIDGNGQLRIDGQLVNGDSINETGKIDTPSFNGTRAGYHEITKTK